MKNILFFLVFTLLFSSCSYSQSFRKDSPANKINMAMGIIENFYVDTINRNKLTEDAIVSLLEKLDPHSGYMNPEEWKEMNEPLQGNFDGIGVQFNMLTDTVYIIQVIPGGPSEKVGIMAGDRIIMVNDTVIAGVEMKNTDIMKRLRGPKGTVADLKVKRGNNPNLISFRIIRDKIPIYSMDASYMIDKTTGYIKLNRFAATSYDEFKDALKKLQSQGMKNLVLDLQDNGGGQLRAAIEIANEFLKKGSLIVYTEGENHRRDEAPATAKGSFINERLVVLVNESSASASEILSGALQDWDRAVIVGRRTFGKGLVQQVFPYTPDGSAFKLTVARYYTPTGRSIQKPYEKGDADSYNMEVIKRYNSGEMLSADSIHFPDSLKYHTLVNKRVVYGGGGIMPDYFVPIDTTRGTDIHRGLIASGTLNKYVMNYVDQNRENVKKQYSDFVSYKSKFEVSEKMLSNLLDMFKKEDYEFHRNKRSAQLSQEDIQTLQNNDYVITDDMMKKFSELLKSQNNNDSEEKKAIEITSADMKDFEKSKQLIKLQIKALIARDIWDMNEYFQIINEDNESLKKAVEIINNEKEYNKLLGRN